MAVHPQYLQHWSTRYARLEVSRRPQHTAMRCAAGGCTEPNDGVSDTAEEAQAQFGCPSPAPDSCPNKPSNQPRLDPIHSYMVSTPKIHICIYGPLRVLSKYLRSH